MRDGPKRRIAGGLVDLEGLPEGGSARVIAFVERFCRITKGSGARRNVRLRAWQCDLIEGMYGDSSRARRAYVQIPRKNGKSTLAACLALYHLVGDGEEGAEVYCVAGDERQARVVFGVARRMVELDPELSQRIQIYRDRLEYQATDSVLEPLPAEADLRLGINPSFVVFDEVGTQRNEDLWHAMSLAMGARERPLLLGITTPGVSTDSIAYKLYEYGLAGTDDEFFFEAYEAPLSCSVDDEDAWETANPALGDFLSLADMRSAVKVTREPEFRRFRLGQWVTQYGGWLPVGAWEHCEDKRRVVPPKSEIVAAFDGSYNGDSTAIVACTVQSPPHFFVINEWASAGQGDDWTVDREAVDSAVIDMFTRYKVVRFVCDPPGWEREISEWAHRYGSDVVKGVPTASRQRMVPAVGEFYAQVCAGAVTHDGDPRLTAHLSHCHIRETPDGGLLSKERRMSPLKIDLAICAVLALSERQRYEPPKPRQIPRRIH